jgi:ATP-dependent helicase/nuclease subunit B
MDLTFTWFGDAGAWPEHPGKGIAVFDHEVVGPLRLLDHIETMFGLGHPEVPTVQRIALYRRKIEAAGVGRFWSESFGVDSWSATREMLAWRDELIEAGWHPKVGLTRSRLADLAAVELAGPDLPFAKADRLRAAIDALNGASSVPLRSITLIDARSNLPTGWRVLVDALERCGTHVEELRAAPQASSGTDLRLMSLPAPGGKTPEFARDGSLTLLTADTELVAAEALSGWIASNATDNDLTFVLGKNSTLLDNSLAKAGLPRLGHSLASPHRALLQVLPLAFALAWKPADPNKLIDFLLLPLGPLPLQVANKLAGVIAKTPGIGGDDWLEAWNEIATVPEGEEAKRHVGRVAEWRAFVEPELHNPETGMRRAVAKDIADRVSAWAAKRLATLGDTLFASVAQIAADLSIAIDATESETLDRVLVERMIEQSIGAGATDPSSFAEAAPWSAVTHPGAIWGEAKTVVWWHFTDTGEAGSETRWNELERAALSDAGCPLDPPELELRRLSAAWERPLQHARDRILLVRPALAAGAETAAHPLWHSLVARHPKLAKEVTVRAESVLRQASPTFAGRTLSRLRETSKSPPEPRPEWFAPPNQVRPRKFESASSLATMLTCPLQWTLKYAAKLHPGLRQSLPAIENLVGTLAHKIAQEIFLPGSPPDLGAVEMLAAVRFEALLPEIAATLLLPGVAAELAAARRSVPPALVELARFLRDEKLTIVGVESDFEIEDTLAPGIGVSGRIDLRATTSNGRPVVVDLKWYRTDKYMREELKVGVALQIAIYGRHISDEHVNVAVGYYALRQRRFLASAPLSGSLTQVINGPSPKQTWEAVLSSFESAKKDLDTGRVRASFEHDGKKREKFEDPYLLLIPRCGRCDFVGICGVTS